MSVMREFLSLRSNVLIVFAGAFAVIFLIKLTSLLPEKYYFSFSSLYSGSDAQPFLIDPPGVSGQKFCEILKKNNIDVGQLGKQTVNCSRKGSPYEYAFNKSQEDLIYSTAFATDAEARSRLHNTVKNFRLTPMSAEEFENSLKYNKTPAAMLERLQQFYGWQLSSRLQKLFEQGMMPAYSALPAEVKRSVLQATDAEGVKLSEAQIAKLRALHQQYLQNFSGAAIAKEKPPAIKKSDIDDIVKYSDSRKRVVSGVGGVYVQVYENQLKEDLKRTFLASGFRLEKEDKNAAIKAMVTQELLNAGLLDYVISILVRVVPVLFFGLVCGLIFGRAELFSISLAGAFAAFLLSWPVILLWDTVVQGSWHDKKELFLVFYALYIISFFFTARVGAMIGAMIRPALPSKIKIQTPQAPTSDMLAAISWKSLAANVFTGVMANGAVYAWNVIIPLAG